MTTALLDKILHHAHIFNLNGKSCIKKTNLKMKGENDHY